MNPFGVKRPWEASEAILGQSNQGKIRLHSSLSWETKTIHRISSRNSTLSIPVKVHLQSSLSSCNEVFFTAGGTSHWITGSSVKSITLPQESPLAYMTCLTCFSFFSSQWLQYMMPLYFVVTLIAAAFHALM